MLDDNELFFAVLRQNLGVFAEKAFTYLNPGTVFLPNWHIAAIAWHLEQVRLGKIKRLIINIPPRYGKSLLTSVAFPAYLLGRDPTRRIITVSYANELAVELSQQTRLLMQSDWYQKGFPATQLSDTKNTETFFKTTQHGFRYAATPGGTLTGIGGDIMIVDDLIKPLDAYSDPLRTKANHFYSSTLLSRLDNKAEGAIIIVMQRLHEDDLVGYVMEMDDWTFLTLPAIATNLEKIQIGLDEFHIRQPGEALHPERESLEDLQKIRKALGEMHFSAQYQQNPVPPGGNMFKLEWVKRYDKLPPRYYFERVILSWDTAVTAAATSDYSVCTVWAKRGDQYFLVDIIRDKLDYPDLEKLVFKLFERYRPELVVIEKSHIGIALISKFRQAGHLEFRGLTPTGDKVSRAAQQSAKIEAGRVFLPKSAPWLDAFEKEILQFPHGKHDDQVDSMVQFLRAMDYTIPGINF